MHSSCEWRPAEPFPNEYMVSDEGSLFSVRTGKILRPSTDKSGYLCFTMCVNGKRKTMKAHRIVAKAFLPNPENKPTVDHINADRQDNRIANLRWATLTEQAQNPHSIEAHSRSICPEIFRRYGAINNYNRKAVVVIKGDRMVGRYPSLLSAALAVGANYSKASEVANGKRKHTGGYVFRFPEEEQT